MLIENVDNFAIWLCDELKVLCEADPVTLSKYVIALLKKDKSESSLRKICIDQLNVFLMDKTKDFVSKVFDCLKNKAYITTMETDCNELDNSCENDILPKFVDSYNNNIVEDTVTHCKPEDFNDITDLKSYSPKNKDKSDTDDEKRAHVKRSLDYAPHKSIDESRKKRRYNEDIDLRDRKRHSSRHRSHKNKKHTSDRIDIKHFDRIEPKLINFSTEKGQWDIMTSCPDFVEKGVCLKGDSCEFDHGTNIVRSDINCIYSASGINQSNNNTNWQPLQMNTTWIDNYSISKHNQNLVDLKSLNDKKYQPETRYCSTSQSNQNSDIYDPSHPEIDAINDTDSRNGITDQAPVYVPSVVDTNSKDGTWWREIDEASTSNCNEGSQVTTVIGSAQSRFKRTLSPVKRGRYNNQGDNNTPNNNYKNNYNNYNRNNNNYNDNNNYNNNNYNSNKFSNKRMANARCLLVTHIPLECNDESKLRQHFTAFGNITDIEVRFQNDPQHALIEFATSDQAKNAFRSPLPILDNRFIRTCLFNRPNDSLNLRVCKESDENNESKYSRKVIQQDSPKKDKDMDTDDNTVDKWPQHSQSSDDERIVHVKEKPLKRVESKPDNWPIASELKLDRRSGITDSSCKEKASEQLTKPQNSKNEDRNPRLIEAQIERQKKLKVINDRKELKTRIEKLEESVEGCKNRLRSLLLEQKNPGCDKDLIKRQLLESYNYFKELRDMLGPLKSKLGPQAQLSESDKIKLKIKNIQDQIVCMDKESEIYKKHLKMITELKRNLVNIQTITKGSRPNRLPSLGETKLDNRPKTLYVTGLYSNSTLGDVKQQFKKYLIEKIEPSDNDMAFFAVEFKTRKEADRVLFEMGKDKKITLSYDKPIQICDPLDFTTTRSDHANTQRGTPRDNCASSDEDDESKIN